MDEKQLKLKIGENLRHARRSKNLTQNELAELVGTTQQHITRYEQGTIAITAVRLRQIEIGLEHNAGFLLHGT